MIIIVEDIRLIKDEQYLKLKEKDHLLDQYNSEQLQ
jgi:hypothetical protein